MTPVSGPESSSFAKVSGQFGSSLTLVYEAFWHHSPCLTFGIVGPYAPGVLRLQISLPDLYPDIPPLITFSTDIFHPLIVPLTTYTFSTGVVDVLGTVSATDNQRLPSGAFSLRNGFPHWFRQSSRAGDSQGDSRRVSGNIKGGQDDVAPILSEGEQDSQLTRDCSIVKALAYVKSSFENPEILDNLQLEAAANPGAWHAWRSFRRLPKAASRTVSPARDEAREVSTEQKQPGDWNWEGVFEQRVKSGIEASISDAVLFGSARPGAQGSETIRFRKLDEEQLDAIKSDMMAAARLASR